MRRWSVFLSQIRRRKVHFRVLSSCLSVHDMTTFANCNRRPVKSKVKEISNYSATLRTSSGSIRYRDLLSERKEHTYIRTYIKYIYKYIYIHTCIIYIYIYKHLVNICTNQAGSLWVKNNFSRHFHDFIFCTVLPLQA